MKDENEIQLAWKIWNLIARLNDLIWVRYENEFIEIHLKDEQDKYLSSINPPGSLTGAQDKPKTPE